MKQILATIWLLLLVGAFLPVSNHVRRFSLERATLFDKPTLSDIEPKLVTVLTLGHRGLYEDFLTIHSLQFLLDQQLKSVNPQVTYDTLLFAARQEPKLESFYMLGCFTISLELKHPEWCEKLNLIGANAIANSWRIPLTQGFIFTNDLKDDAAAAKWYALAASRPGAPEYLGSLATKLAAKNQMTPEDLEHSLRMMIDIPGGSKLRETLEKSANRKREGSRQ